MPATSQTTDILLVGGGVIGLSLAWELAQHGASVCLVDSGEFGKEASWAAAGMLPPGPTVESAKNLTTYEQLHGLSHRLHPDWHARLAENTEIDNGYRPTGAIYVSDGSAVADAALERNLEEWARWGLDFHRLDLAAQSDLESNISPQKKAVLLTAEGQLRPPRHLKALITACSKVGVKMIPNCQVFDWQIDRNRITAVKTDLGTISAGQICLTSGCWSGALAARLHLDLPIRPIRGQILLLKGAPNLLKRIVNQGPRYLTPRPDGRVLVGSTQEDVGFNKGNTVEGMAGLMNFATNICPALADFALEKSWSGLRPGTIDELPYLGQIPNFDNAWIAAGHFRAGIQLSPATAVVMRSLMLNQSSPIDVAALGVDRRVS